jgi:ABC-type multidrug transport system fused ATPase/permease subunit
MAASLHGCLLKPHSRSRAFMACAQAPVLFTGTVRDNLDPAHALSDGELWAALAKCSVDRKIRELAKG